jgi:hypothetical protein
VIYSKHEEVSAVIKSGIPICSLSYRTATWEITSATGEHLNQVWIVFEDGRKRHLFKHEWLKLIVLHQRIRVTNARPEEL